MPTSPRKDRFAAGTMLDGRFMIGGVLGTGELTELYLATDKHKGRPTVLKFLTLASDHPLRSAAEHKFHQEAQAVSRILHPNIPRIVGWGHTGPNNTPYIALEPIAGIRLREWLDRHGPLSLAQARSLFMPCTQAIAELHSKGVVHGALEPNNLFMLDAGTNRARLVPFDFGCVRAETLHIGGNAVPIGQIRYQSPEFIETGAVTPALDVFQLAISIVESLLPSDHPKRGDAPVEWLSQGLRSGALGAALERATLHDHTRRTPNAAQFFDALQTPHKDVFLETNTELLDEESPFSPALTDPSLLNRAPSKAPKTPRRFRTNNQSAPNPPEPETTGRLDASVPFERLLLAGIHPSIGMAVLSSATSSHTSLLSDDLPPSEPDEDDTNEPHEDIFDALKTTEWLGHQLAVMGLRKMDIEKARKNLPKEATAPPPEAPPVLPAPPPPLQQRARNRLVPPPEERTPTSNAIGLLLGFTLGILLFALILAVLLFVLS